MATDAFRVRHTIRGATPILKSLIAQIRFEDGQLYLDRCGRMLRQLMAESGGEWTAATASPEGGAGVTNIATGHRFNFGWESASLSLDYSGVADEIDTEGQQRFVGAAENLLEWVTDQLEVKRVIRVGFRQRYFFPFDSKEETERWLMGLGLFSLSPSLTAAFGGECDGVYFRTVFKLPDCWLRLSLGGIERSAEIPAGDTMVSVRQSVATRNNKKALLEAMKQKRARQIDPAYFADYDLDAYLEEPESYNLESFLREHAQNGLDRLRAALAAGAK